MISIHIKSLVMALSGLVAFAAAHSATLDDVKARGALRCGVNQQLAGFSRANSLGEYSGFDIDVCRAVATAVFNDPEAVDMLPVTAGERFIALKSGALDILSRNTTWTLQRNSDYGAFVGVNFYDGQGFMVSKRTGIRSALELDNKPICVSRNTTSELNAADFFTVSDIRYRPVYFDDEYNASQGYIKGECIAITTDRSALASNRTTFAQPETHLVLPEVISKEPLGPVVGHNDSEWENIVRWSLNCMINAEELGVNSNNVNVEGIGSTPAIRRMLGIEGNTGEVLGLHPAWCSRIISLVGNYGEVYDRHIGPDTAIGLPRGINGLWTNGGLIYAPPIR
ncbi:MAG: general L-amino acid transport system substrate-binding protein [Granulosicoccus sp.]|jgi:general L-amino acid transport system substrate-binding protein